MRLVEVTELNKTYEKFKLDNVSFHLESGHIYGFIGANGSGKSTTMKGMTGLINLDSGSVLMNGKSIYELSSVEKEKIGFTMDEICLPDNLKVNSLNKIFKSTFDNWDENVFFGFLKSFNIDTSKKIKELSKGMKAKFNIAISLSHNANILILDEPMNGLDPVARDEFCELLSNFILDGEDRTILISSHIISDLEKICTDFIFINEGKIIIQEKKSILDNNFIKINVSEEEFENIDRHKIIRYKRAINSYDILALKENSEYFANCESANAEDFLVFMIRGKTI